MTGPFHQLMDQCHSDMQQEGTASHQKDTVSMVDIVWTWMGLAFRYIQVYDINLSFESMRPADNHSNVITINPVAHLISLYQH